MNLTTPLINIVHMHVHVSFPFHVLTKWNVCLVEYKVSLGSSFLAQPPSLIVFGFVLRTFVFSDRMCEVVLTKVSIFDYEKCLQFNFSLYKTSYILTLQLSIRKPLIIIF